MIKSLLVIAVLTVACNAYAEDDTPEPSQCSGMARTLQLPDEKVFGSFATLMEQSTQMEHGLKSNKHMLILLQQALDKGYGAGLAQGAINAYGRDFAFKLFMKMCYKDDYATRNKWIAIKP